VRCAASAPQQIDAVSRLTPITMIVNLVNVAIILGTLWDTGSNGFLTLWALAVLSAALLAARAWLRARRNKPKEASARATRRLVVQAFLLAAIWGALPIAVLGNLEPMNQMIIACLMAGMIAGGAFTLSTFPHAGLTYMWTMTLASALALFLCDSRSYLVTAGFLLLFAVFMSRNDAAGVRRRDADRQ
jgi:fructose-specific phosphotransferase system IIC component